MDLNKSVNAQPTTTSFDNTNQEMGADKFYLLRTWPSITRSEIIMGADIFFVGFT